jgi:uncharacterized protein (DUF58 family)
VTPPTPTMPPTAAAPDTAAPDAATPDVQASHAPAPDVAVAVPDAAGAGERGGRPHPTATGTAVLTGSISLVVLGWALGDAVLSVVGAAGLAAVFLAVLSFARQPRLEVAREVQPVRVERGQAATGSVTVHNRSGRPAGPLRAVEPVGDRRVAVRLPVVRAHSRRTSEYRIPTSRRGELVVGPLRLIRRDPLGLLLAQRAVGEPTVVRVHPRIHPIGPRPGERSRHLEGPNKDTAQGSISFHTLREYVVGDDLRKVHWRSSARTGTLMVRLDMDTSRPSTVVALDTRADHYDGDRFEEAVDFAASVVAASLARGFPVRVVTSEGGRWSGGSSGSSGQAVMDGLAGVQAGGGGDIHRLGSAVLARREHHPRVVVAGRVALANQAAVAGMARSFATLVVASFTDGGGAAVSVPRAVTVTAGTAAEAADLWVRGGGSVP